MAESQKPGSNDAYRFNGPREELYGTQPRVAVKLARDRFRELLPKPDSIPQLVERTFPGASRGLHYSPLIASLKPETVNELVQRATLLDPKYQPVDFNQWYQLEYDTDDGGEEAPRLQAAFNPRNPIQIDDLVEKLKGFESFEDVSVLRDYPPPTVDASDDKPYAAKEGFLDAAPAGIDARYAWTFTGGDGAGIGFVDMEQGWDLNHPDLKAQNISLISGSNYAYHFHGTGVLGEVMMTDNTEGGIGIAPKCTGRVISQIQTGSTASAIVGAVATMQFGDVLLLEAQNNYNGSYAPVETDQVVWDAIRLATALGIIVIEAGANGGLDLDTVTDSNGKQYLNRNSADFRDSGAIIVGAGSSTSPHTRLGFSSYGSRIDCFGWGENVVTSITNDPWWLGTSTDATIQGPETYTETFNGTSSASPIIAGAAILVQGIYASQTGSNNPRFRLSPFDMRRILSTTGTASSTPATDKIGVLPDLRAIINGSILNLTPDVYVRDFVGDTGTVNTGIFSASPDIIVRQSPVANPQASLGQGSGTENSTNLSQPVLTGRDQTIYIRIRNRGAGDAQNVTATVYWAPPATLLSPPSWNKIGTVAAPSVPTGNVLTVTPGLLWPAASIPGIGHYCFVAIVGTAADPAPNPATAFASWDQYEAFIASNNNIAWRNFDVTSAPPSTGPKNFHSFPVIIPGAWDSVREFTLETLGSLPRGSEVELAIPLVLAKQLDIKLQPGQIVGEGEERHAVLSLPALANRQIGRGFLAKGLRADCTLRVKVPEDTYKRPGEWEFGVRQIVIGSVKGGEKEVGRCTWRFGQVEKIGGGGGGGCGCGGEHGRHHHHHHHDCCHGHCAKHCPKECSGECPKGD